MACTADFETITDPNDCRVWAWGIHGIKNDDFNYGNSIGTFFDFVKEHLDTYYFHNLKFDGEFILNYLFKLGFTWVKSPKDLFSHTFTTLISDKGQFYSMEICFKGSGKNRKSIKIYDSLKIIPLGIAEIAKTFGLQTLKGELDYDKFRSKDHELEEYEIDYLHNDVHIAAEALNLMFEQNLTKITQGSNALADYKNVIGKKTFERWFPKLDYDYDIRQAYKGGWTYLKKGLEEKDIGEGIVLDVNSLYPHVLHDCAMPYGEGKFFTGKYQDDKDYNLYIQSFTCHFKIKPNHLPTIQLKNNLSFVPTEYIESSGIEDVTLCLTNVDLKLFLDHYDVWDIDWHNGWKFRSSTIMFRDYVDKWTAIKEKASIEGNKGLRTIAKLMMNALYGKFGLNPKVCSKIPYYRDGKVIYLLDQPEIRDPIYIPVAVFTTSYARDITIRAAQKNYDRFVYADTDSLHLIGSEIPTEINVHPTHLGFWKHESDFTRARFIRQKCYLEEIDGEFHITCAGMPKGCYPLVTWDNFHTGVEYEGKLQFKRVEGGAVLSETTFKIKEKSY